MAISQKDIKLLWGRSASRCAICKIELSQNKQNASDSFPFGEQAHIVAEEEDGPRGRSVFTKEERNTYHNLILLCPNDHTLIDKNTEDYPVERLYLIKSEHELWVQQRLSTKSDSEHIIANSIYGHLIDSAVQLCHLEHWEGWTCLAIGAAPSFDEKLTFEIFNFRQKVISAIWPGKLPELERSLVTLSIILSETANTFSLHAESRGGRFTPTYFYKEAIFPEEIYQQKLKQFNNWMADYHFLIIEVTKAANWFADVVRRDINPMFFAIEGKFLLTDISGLIISGIKTRLVEYSESEKEKLPQSFVEMWQSKEKNY